MPPRIVVAFDWQQHDVKVDALFPYPRQPISDRLDGAWCPRPPPASVFCPCSHVQAMTKIVGKLKDEDARSRLTDTLSRPSTRPIIGSAETSRFALNMCS